MQATAGIKPSCPLALRRPCRSGLQRVNFKRSATHVEAYLETSRDAGSIPAASTKATYGFFRKWPSFMDLRKVCGHRFRPKIAYMSDFVSE